MLRYEVVVVVVRLCAVCVVSRIVYICMLVECRTRSYSG